MANPWAGSDLAVVEPDGGSHQLRRLRECQPVKAGRAQRRLDMMVGKMLQPFALTPMRAAAAAPRLLPRPGLTGGAERSWEPKPFHFHIPHVSAPSTAISHLCLTHHLRLHFCGVLQGIFMKEATSVAVDAEDRVYVFNRGNMPVLVFDPDGFPLAQWGNPTPFEGVDPYTLTTTGIRMSRYKGTDFVRPHSVRVDVHQNLWLVDDDANCITK